MNACLCHHPIHVCVTLCVCLNQWPVGVCWPMSECHCHCEQDFCEADFCDGVSMSQGVTRSEACVYQSAFVSVSCSLVIQSVSV